MTNEERQELRVSIAAHFLGGVIPHDVTKLADAILVFFEPKIAALEAENARLRDDLKDGRAEALEEAAKTVIHARSRYVCGFVSPHSGDPADTEWWSAFVDAEAAIRALIGKSAPGPSYNPETMPLDRLAIIGKSATERPADEMAVKRKKDYRLPAQLRREP